MPGTLPCRHLRKKLAAGHFFFFSFLTIAWTEGEIRAGVRMVHDHLNSCNCSWWGFFLVWLKQNIRKCYGIATQAGHIGRISSINLGILKTLLYYQTAESGYTLYQSKFMDLGSVPFEANCGQITAPDARSHWLATFPQYSPDFCCVCDSNTKLLLFVCFFYSSRWWEQCVNCVAAHRNGVFFLFHLLRAQNAVCLGTCHECMLGVPGGA